MSYTMIKRHSATTTVLLTVALFAANVLHADAAEPDHAEPDHAAAAKRVEQIIAHRGASAERPECTLAAIQRAIDAGATAVEVDVRTSRDGELFILHDATLDRTTNGKGPANALTLAQLQALDAGSWFDPKFKDERIPSLIQAARTCRGKIDLLLDLKEQGGDYDRHVANVILEHGDPAKSVVGVRSLEQAKRFRALLPKAKQLALIPSVDAIEDFAKAGVDTIRLWPRWLEDGNQPAERVRATGKQLHLNGTNGELEETLALLVFQPNSLSSDDPARLKNTLARVIRGDLPRHQLSRLIEKANGVVLETGEVAVGARTFLNRDYRMLEVPHELLGKPRYSFAGGAGSQVRLRFRQPAVVFATFDYNDTGLWSFDDRRSPTEFGWHLWRSDAYRGTSNGERAGRPHHAAIWFREFKTEQELSGLPAWWLCLGIVDLDTARTIDGFTAGLATAPRALVPSYSHAANAARIRPLQTPEFDSPERFRQWQTDQRAKFANRILYPYAGQMTVVAGQATNHQGHGQQEFQVQLDGQRLFRFFRLEPHEPIAENPLPTIVCFMGHGKIAQILDDEASYQHGCAAKFANAGYLVFAMENIGMEPGRDTHHDLDQSLRLEGYGWYSLLFAHQRFLLDQVFSDASVDTRRVGVTGVSTGGLLALSAAAIEPRIAAASVHGIFGSMRISFIQDRHKHCSCGAIPGLLPEFDLPELALLVAPRSLHISNGTTDGFSPAEAKRCVDLIAPRYRKSGGAQPLFTISSGGHEFDFPAAEAFFRRSFHDTRAR